MFIKSTAALVAAFMLVAVSAAPAAPVDCPKACTMDYRPVCAKSSTGTLQVFGNACTLKAHNCQRPKELFTFANNGECTDCPKACTKEYSPVCGVNAAGEYKVFGNECTFKSHNCENPTALFNFANKGKCAECPKACTKEYAPVCGVNAAGEYKVFGNECTFKAHNCENPKTLFTFENKGQCCPKGCNKMYRPVCAASADGVRRVFGNECMLQVHNCEKPTEAFAFQSQGEC
ncbi:hypothetical protein BGZ81_011589 [Podila clonocystis]|nr:hypothetical protein BGZ81_011589 [Podila clonocystis]